MRPENPGHATCVEAWLNESPGLESAQLAALFERALEQLWRRALQTLGEITLTAIVDRVLYTASERYPLLSSLKVHAAQIRFEEFRAQDWTRQGLQLPDAVRFTLVEFFIVMGNLTAEILTPALHEFLYRGALAGEKGILFSFEETEERLRSNARSLGWDLDAQIERRMIEIVFIPQPNILVEAHLLMMRERIETMKARRVAVDSVSVFLHKVRDAQLAREKVLQLASIIQNTQAVGFLATDIRYGASEISRFDVEETVVDGVFVLSSTQEGLERHRYIEVYKLRNTAHLKGRHSLIVGHGGITVFPRYGADPAYTDPKQMAKARRRVSSGLPGLDPLLGGGLLERSVTLVSGQRGNRQEHACHAVHR